MWQWQAATFRRTDFEQATRIGSDRVFPAMEGGLERAHLERHLVKQRAEAHLAAGFLHGL
jgi:hypothetical protein